jgi:SAM-dependent methyltransferase
VIIANNVLAHVPDTNDFIRAIATVLKPDGVAVLEFPYVVDLIDGCEFDTIYHEHVFYLSLSAVRALFERHGLFLNDAMRLPIHGGSLRVFASRKRGETPRLATLLASEQERGVTRHDYYLGFASRVAALAASLSSLLRCLKAGGARIAAYGAAAKGATLLNYVKLPPGTIEYVVDRNPHKQGKLMPGQGIPICAPEALVIDRPHYTLLLSWNFAEEVMREQHRYVAAGGRFIVPIPHPRIVEPPVAAQFTQAAQ